MTIWTNLVLTSEKPNVRFYPIWHTPLVDSHSYEDTGGDATKNLIDKIRLQTYYSLFKHFCLPFIQIGQLRIYPMEYSDSVVNSHIPLKYRFVLSNMIGFILIGSIDRLRSEIKAELERAFPE